MILEIEQSRTLVNIYTFFFAFRSLIPKLLMILHHHHLEPFIQALVITAAATNSYGSVSAKIEVKLSLLFGAGENFVKNMIHLQPSDSIGLFTRGTLLAQYPV